MRGPESDGASASRKGESKWGRGGAELREYKAGRKLGEAGVGEKRSKLNRSGGVIGELKEPRPSSGRTCDAKRQTTFGPWTKVQSASWGKGDVGGSEKGSLSSAETKRKSYLAQQRKVRETF